MNLKPRAHCKRLGLNRRPILAFHYSRELFDYNIAGIQ